MIFETGSQIHSFKLATMGMEGMTSAFAYGYAYFMQRRDSNSKRGYLQVHQFIVLTIALVYNDASARLLSFHNTHFRHCMRSWCRSLHHLIYYMET